MEARGVSDADMLTIGGVRRDLADIVTEVAEGRSHLVYMGG
jgi:hypothetical protein